MMTRVASHAPNWAVEIWIPDLASFGECDRPSKIWNLNYVKIQHKNYQNMIIYSPRAHMRRVVTSGWPRAEIWGGGRSANLSEVLIGDSISRLPSRLHLPSSFECSVQSCVWSDLKFRPRLSKLCCYTMCDNSIMSTYIIVTCHY